MTREQAISEITSKFGIGQTPADWLNEFDSREEAHAAWIGSKVDCLRKCASCGEIVGSDWDQATVHLDRDNGITCGGKLV